MRTQVLINQFNYYLPGILRQVVNKIQNEPIITIIYSSVYMLLVFVPGKLWQVISL